MANNQRKPLLMQLRRVWQRVRPALFRLLLSLLVAALVIVGSVWYWTVAVRRVGWVAWLDITDKTGWEWLELAIIPLVLAVGGLLFSRAERKTDREIAKAVMRLRGR